MTLPTRPIPPISPLWPKLTDKERLDRAAKAMETAPAAAREQLNALLVQINNVAHPYSLGQGTVLDASLLQHLLERDRGEPPSRKRFAEQLDCVQQYERHIRIGLGDAKDSRQVAALQQALSAAMRLLRYAGDGTE